MSMSYASEHTRKISDLIKWGTETKDLDNYLQEINYFQKVEDFLFSYLETNDEELYKDLIQLTLPIIKNEKSDDHNKSKIYETIRKTLLENNTSILDKKYSEFTEIEDFKINELNIQPFINHFLEYDIDILIEGKKEGGFKEIQIQMTNDLMKQ